MRSSRAAVTALLFFGAVAVPIVSAGPRTGDGRVLLEDVKALTLRMGKQTRGRRSTVAQLDCMSGPCHETPKVVQCRNVGTDGYETQWKCEAEFSDPGISFDQSSLIVSCEGFDYPDDPFITAGSCEIGRAHV